MCMPLNSRKRFVHGAGYAGAVSNVLFLNRFLVAACFRLRFSFVLVSQESGSGFASCNQIILLFLGEPCPWKAENSSSGAACDSGITPPLINRSRHPDRG